MPDLNTVTFDASRHRIIAFLDARARRRGVDPEVIHGLDGEHYLLVSDLRALLAAPKAVTFDASQWQLVPKVPTEEMIWKAEEDAPEFDHGDPWYGSEQVSDAQVRAVYAAMLAAAPTPAAQSAGQEAVAWATHHDEPMLFLDREEAAQYCDDNETPIPLVKYAAPVNGGERATDAQQAGGSFEFYRVGHMHTVYGDDAAIKALLQYHKHLENVAANALERGIALTSPAKEQK